jgi:hypothetical protein
MTEENKLPVVKGKFQHYTAKQRGRMYPKELIDKEVDKWTQKKASDATTEMLSRWNKEFKQ